MTDKLVDLLHAGAIVAVIVIVVVVTIKGRVVVDRKTELDKPMDTVGEYCRLFQRKSRSEQRRIIQEPDEVLDSLVALVGLSLLTQRLDDRVRGVELEGLLGAHVAGHRTVAQGL